MLPPLPDFKQLAIRTQVEWQGSTRPVIAYFKQWHLHKQMLVAGCFEDEPEYGEWVVINADESLHIANQAESLLKIGCQTISSTERHLSWELRQKAVNRLARLTHNSLLGRGVYAARLFHLTELPHEPRFVVMTAKNSYWYWASKTYSPIPFRAPFSGFGIAEELARKLLLEEWSREESDTRFAWDWPQWSTEEKKMLCLGTNLNWQELERVMKWVLMCARVLWNHENDWCWRIHPTHEGRGTIDTRGHHGIQFRSYLRLWQEWLFGYFVPNWHDDWLERHQCVRDFWYNTLELQSVYILHPPTMHEQLEARLSLREWLEGKATQDEVNKLMSCMV